MPIEKVPIVHKFGIISHSQRLELQERLLKQSYLDKYASKKPHFSSKNPLEVSEEFVQQFNAAEGLDEQERFEAVAFKMLERVKRRAGLKTAGQGSHVDLPVAWTELSQLAQCKGKIQEECLDVLVTCLDQATLSKDHIPALFFLAETCLYWLRTDAINQPYLRTAELKLLRMGQLTFARLFYHHMAGQLQRHDDFKSRLFTYLDGFGDCQEAYNPYPNALLCIRYINEVGKMIVGTNATQLDPGEVKEGDVVQQDARDAETQHGIFQEAQASQYDNRSVHSVAISSSVHDLSPTLWHSLDVWRCTNHLSGGLPDALNALACCGTGLASESWVDGMCALHILADAAKVKLGALRVLQNLAKGAPPPPESPQKRHSAKDTSPRDPGQGSSTFKSLSFESKGLSDIYEKTEDGSVPSAKSRERDDALRDSSQNQHRNSKPPSNTFLNEKTMSSQVEDASKMTDYTRVNTGCEAEMGSARDSHMSETSSVPTYTNAVDAGNAGLHGWHWEVGITYTDILADICLHGNTSEIQKVALVGNNKDVEEIGRREMESPMVSAGLLDLVHFRAKGEASDGSSNDWSWRIRYSAIQGLVKICQCCVGQQTKEGMRTVSWNALTQAQVQEHDGRVLEALKVGQVDASIEKLLTTHLTVPPSAIGAKMASGLSNLYLPPLPPPVESPAPRKLPVSSRCSPRKVSPRRQSPPRKPLRTTLKDEIALATALYEPPVSYEKRTAFDLNRVVEDQWRKELQKQLEEEEEERQKQLEEKQKEAEVKEKEAEESRKLKLKDKYKGNKAYEIKTRKVDKVKSPPGSKGPSPSTSASRVKVGT